ncbi:hypothetical protein GCM10009101_19400 [Brevundimonas lenta]
MHPLEKVPVRPDVGFGDMQVAHRRYAQFLLRPGLQARLGRLGIGVIAAVGGRGLS